MPEALTVQAKYVFVDVVKFSESRSVEAQADIVTYLSAIVLEAIQRCDTPNEATVLLPAGDAVCVALLNFDSPYDVHIKMALLILELLQTHNQNSQDPQRRFQLRVGVNANVDNLVTDINGKRNVAGPGINLAQRIMSSADGNQVMVGEVVYETLRHRETYMSAFRRFDPIVKHELMIPIYQLISPSVGLNTDIPRRFRPVAAPSSGPVETKLPKLVAYYFAFSARYRTILPPLLSVGSGSYAATILLWYLAHDKMDANEASDIIRPHPKTWGAGRGSIEQIMDYYRKTDFWLLADLADYIAQENLVEFSRYFEKESDLIPQWPFVNAAGKDRLRKDWPEIFREFELETKS